MSRRRKTTLLIAAAIGTAGCAHSGFEVTPRSHKSWKPVEDTRLAEAPEAVPPKILPETHFASGQLLEAHGLIGDAIVQYQKAVALNHGYVAAYHRLGLLLGTVGRHDEATRALRRAVALVPDSPTLRNNLGYQLLMQQDWDGAERAFARAIELRPDFPRAHVNRGMALSRQGRFDEAFDSFWAAVPEADAYYNLGLMFQGQQCYEEAAEAFGHALDINPRFSAAKKQLRQLAHNLPRTTPLPLVTPRETLAALFEPDVAPMEMSPEPDTMIFEQDNTFSDETLALTIVPAEETMGDGPPSMWAELEERLQIVRNQIACWEVFEAKREREGFALASEAPIASEADPFPLTPTPPVPVQPAFMMAFNDASLTPWWEAIEASQLTLGRIVDLPPEFTEAPRTTMALTIIPDEPAEEDADEFVVNSSPADEPPIASEAFIEFDQEEPCDEEYGFDEGWEEEVAPGSSNPDLSTAHGSFEPIAFALVDSSPADGPEIASEAYIEYEEPPCEEEFVLVSFLNPQ